MENLKYPNGAIGYENFKNRNIGYIQIKRWQSGIEYRIIDEISGNFWIDQKDSSSIWEMNGGGSIWIENRQQVLLIQAFRKVRYRNGPHHTDFARLDRRLYIESSGTPYVKTIMVLTNEYCQRKRQRPTVN